MFSSVALSLVFTLVQIVEEHFPSRSMPVTVTIQNDFPRALRPRSIFV